MRRVQRQVIETTGFDSLVCSTWKNTGKLVPEMRGAQGRNRTTDTRIFSPLLYQLSYLGFPAAVPLEAGLIRVLARCVERGYTIFWA
jgi:hypothetical protein